MLKKYEPLLSFLNKKVAITAHRHPDGDAIGSAIALQALVKSAGGEPSVFLSDPLETEFTYLKGTDKIRYSLDSNENFDAAFILDCGSFDQVGPVFPDISGIEHIFVIDHHKTRKPFGTYEIVDSNASAVGILIHELISTSGIPLNSDMAKGIWCSIVADTGGFRYSSTDERTMLCGAEMLKAGADPWEAAQALYESNPPERMKLLGYALQTLEITHNGKTAVMYITSEMLEKAGASVESSSGFVNYPRSIAGVEVAGFIRPNQDKKGEFKISLRSVGTVPVDGVAQAFGGGGHRNAAGCSFKGSVEETKNILCEEIEKLWKHE